MDSYESAPKCRENADILSQAPPLSCELEGRTTIVACFTPSARRRRRAPGARRVCSAGRGRLGVIEIIRACSLIRAQSTALKKVEISRWRARALFHSGTTICIGIPSETDKVILTLPVLK